MWRETWHVIWGGPSVSSVLGAVFAVVLVFVAACVALLVASGRRHARKQRERQQDTRSTVPDGPLESPLTDREQEVLAGYEEELR